MSTSRFHLPNAHGKESTATLTGDEAKHCVQVLRKQIGDHIIIFDGAGYEATAEITAISSSKGVDLKILEQRMTPAPAVFISLIQSIPKGANMEWIIEKAVELGVNAIYPVLTERTVVRLDAKDAAKKREKWQRVALETCKQCGQNWLPQIHAPTSFTSIFETLPTQDLNIIAALQSDSRSLKAILTEPRAKNQEPRIVSLAIGPEGDFTPAEYAAARVHGFVPASLGPLVLRVETAALFALSVLSHEWRGDSGLRPVFAPSEISKINA
jgi:16S rRNA (uracil1498-N3)-methyltransferase